MGVASSNSLAGQTVGRFVIGERLGKGGMGEVYRAEDTRLKRTVALKRLSPYLRVDSVYRSRFQEEAERASRFTDPHVAAIYDVMDEQDETLLVMEYVEGQTLRRHLHDPMSLDEFLKIAVECAEALVAADHVGIVHCDIKPENIMLSTAGNVKILDFGVAKFLPRSDQSSTVDRSATIGGTPAYMSPEVLLERGADGRSDIFSLGLVLYEALAGHHPFLSDSYVATTHRILHEKAASIRIFNPTVPEELDRIISRMMAKDPAERYANAQDLVEDLRTVQAGVKSSKPLPRPLRYQRHTRARSLAVAAVALLLAGGYAFYSWKHRPPPFQERGWALITDFDSTGEDPIPDKGVREGLTIALQQSPYVNVYPRTRIYEALQRMKRTDVSRIDETIGREICRRENIQVLLTGSIEHLGQAFQIIVRAENPVTGSLLFAEKEHFNRKEQFFDGVDKLARDVRKDLGESVTKIENTTRPLAKVTTSSFDALQLYSEAADFMAQGKPDAVPNLLQGALQFDPDFAMAHKLMAYVYEAIGNTAKEREQLRRAYELRNTVTDREQRLIEAHYYDIEGEYEKQVRSLQILARLYPDDPEVHQDLAFAYRNIADINSAIQEMREVLRLEPLSAHGYFDLVLFLSRNNQGDEATATYNEAIARGLDTPPLHWSFGLALLGKGQVSDAKAQFSIVQKSGGAYESVGRIYLARADIYAGQLKSSIERLRAGILLDKAARNKAPESLQRYLLASVYQDLGKVEFARRELKAAALPDDDGAPEPPDPENLRRIGTLYARMGDVSSAEDVLRKLQHVSIASPTSFNKSCAEALAGEIALARHRDPDAIRRFHAGLALYHRFLFHQGLALAYEQQGDWSRAAPEWRAVVDSKGEVLQDFVPSDWILAHLRLARINSKLKDVDHARAEYQTFIHIWAETDQKALLRQVQGELENLSAR